jgi:hypothetical protein
MATKKTTKSANVKVVDNRVKTLKTKSIFTVTQGTVFSGKVQTDYGKYSEGVFLKTSDNSNVIRITPDNNLGEVISLYYYDTIQSYEEIEATITLG